MTRKRSVEDDDLLAALTAFVTEHGYPPSIRELAVALGVSSTRTVHDRLVDLRDEGKVEWDEGRARTLRIVHGSRDKR